MKPSIDKFILDPTCGGRMMWVNKNHPNVIYGDIRQCEKGHIPEQINHCIIPDIIMDFKDIPFDDESFKLVVYDPPHLPITTVGTKSILAKKFGSLSPDTWESDLRQGFDECWRVLEPYGILIFKWNDNKHTYSHILKIIGKEPLFQNILRRKTAKYATYWACFMKIPKGE